MIQSIAKASLSDIENVKKQMEFLIKDMNNVYVSSVKNNSRVSDFFSQVFKDAIDNLSSAREKVTNAMQNIKIGAGMDVQKEGEMISKGNERVFPPSLMQDYLAAKMEYKNDCILLYRHDDEFLAIGEDATKIQKVLGYKPVYANLGGTKSDKVVIIPSHDVTAVHDTMIHAGENVAIQSNTPTAHLTKEQKQENMVPKELKPFFNVMKQTGKTAEEVMEIIDNPQGFTHLIPEGKTIAEILPDYKERVKEMFPSEGENKSAVVTEVQQETQESVNEITPKLRNYVREFVDKLSKGEIDADNAKNGIIQDWQDGIKITSSPLFSNPEFLKVGYTFLIATGKTPDAEHAKVKYYNDTKDISICFDYPGHINEFVPWREALGMEQIPSEGKENSIVIEQSPEWLKELEEKFKAYSSALEDYEEMGRSPFVAPVDKEEYKRKFTTCKEELISALNEYHSRMSKVQPLQDNLKEHPTAIYSESADNHVIRFGKYEHVTKEEIYAIAKALPDVHIWGKDGGKNAGEIYCTQLREAEHFRAMIERLNTRRGGGTLIAENITMDIEYKGEKYSDVTFPDLIGEELEELHSEDGVWTSAKLGDDMIDFLIFGDPDSKHLSVDARLCEWVAEDGCYYQDRDLQVSGADPEIKITNIRIMDNKNNQVVQPLNGIIMEQQHATLEDVISRAKELGIDYHPIAIHSLRSLEMREDYYPKTYNYATIKADGVDFHETIFDVFDDNKGISLEALPIDIQQEALDIIYDEHLSNENENIMVIYDQQNVPEYALSAIINGDFSGIDDPEDEKNIHDFMDKNSGCLYEVSEDKSFSNNPAFGKAADCHETIIYKVISPKELLEATEQEEVLLTREGEKIEPGMKVLWHDPEEEAKDLSRVYTVDSINGEVVLISDEYSEAEVYAEELSKAYTLKEVTEYAESLGENFEFDCNHYKEAFTGVDKGYAVEPIYFGSSPVDNLVVTKISVKDGELHLYTPVHDTDIDNESLSPSELLTVQNKLEEINNYLSSILKKFELIPSDKEGLYRVKALRSFGFVEKGEIGGYVEKENNLSHLGTAWVADEATVRDNAFVRDNAQVKDAALVSKNAEVGGYSVISGTAVVTDDAVVSIDKPYGVPVISSQIINEEHQICSSEDFYDFAYGEVPDDEVEETQTQGMRR